MRSIEHMRLRRAVKEAMDDLPEGICFFDRNGLPVLCNHRMHDLMFRMTGHDLQFLPELTGALGIAPGSEDGAECRRAMPDGSIWSFSLRQVRAEEDRGYIRAAAFDVTELCAEQERLRETNEAQQLRIPEERAHDPLKELMELAASLEMRIDLDGEVPGSDGIRALLSLILRECLINTARHARGDTLYVALSLDGEHLRAEIANNGAPPDGAVAEGGGLSSLRRRVEAAGGSMLVESSPAFRLTVILPGSWDSSGG